MRILVIRGNAFSIFAAAVLLSGCGGSSIPKSATGDAAGAQARRRDERFHYTGKEQSFVVPSGVTKLTVVAYGARGAGKINPSNYDQVPGWGGRVWAVVPVQSGETLHVFVGGAPHSRVSLTGGFNGGGNGSDSGWGGGGASDIREGGDALSDRILVAGGGGGGGGGGGSSYVEPKVKKYRSTQNARHGDGVVIFTW